MGGERTIPASIIQGGNLSARITVPDSLAILDEPKAVPGDNCGCFRIMSPEHGDQRVAWDRTQPAQVADAGRVFNQLVERGLVPHEVGVGAVKTNRIMDVFDATAEEVVFLPVALVAGG